MPDIPFKLELTNGFFVDFRQIARLVSVGVSHQAHGRIAVGTYAACLGTSVRRAKNLCSIAIAFSLLRPIVLKVTGLGQVVNEYDPYLDDLGTLWLLHYSVSSSERYVVWNRLVNQVIPQKKQFSTAVARSCFDDLAEYYSERSIRKTLQNEISVFWNAYTEQSFRHLDYLRAESDQIYIVGDHEPVPPGVFHAATVVYRERYAPGAATLEINALARAANSPGRLFSLTERQVRDLLDEIKQMGYIFVETRADLDQIRFRDDSDLPGIMRRYYEER